jgi:succinate dehydrogenase iron-sulfur subunit
MSDRMVQGAAREAVLRVFRGDAAGGELVDFRVPFETGMVVLDAIHWIQGHLAPDLAVRWNCKAAKCGSCSAEVNGKPSLLCKTRMDHLPAGEPIVVRPMKTFPVVKDLVTDVKWNYQVNQRIAPFTPRANAEWKWHQPDVDRAQEFRKCIECFLCQNVCHVLRTHELKDQFAGPRFFVRVAGLEMHPMDAGDRLGFLKDEAGIGLCNITKCCTEVCPEGITITDNAIIPLKERVVDRYYDPLKIVWRAMTGGGKKPDAPAS